jgi:hypothetical protein
MAVRAQVPVIYLAEAPTVEPVETALMVEQGGMAVMEEKDCLVTYLVAWHFFLVIAKALTAEMEETALMVEQVEMEETAALVHRTFSTAEMEETAVMPMAPAAKVPPVLLEAMVDVYLLVPAVDVRFFNSTIND